MRKNRKIIYLAGFLFSIPIALTSYINSSFLENYTNEFYVGIIYILASVLSIIGMLKMPKILTSLGNRLTALTFSLILCLSLVAMSLGSKDFIVIPAFLLYFISINFIVASLDIFVEDFSIGASIGRFRGFYLVICNLAWVIAQMISGSIIAKSSFQGIYLLSSFFMILFCVIFIFFLHDFKDPKYRKMPVLKTLKSFIQSKNISKIYLINLILKFFYAWMIIYSPIYLHEYLGFDWSQIGIIFTIMLLPFIILEFPLGKLSDRIGERKMLAYGFLISAISTLLIPLVAEPKIWIWAILLFATRSGAAMIEVMSESYFFKSVSEEDGDEISFFRNTTPVSFILAPLLAIPILFFVPSFQYLFFVLSAIMFCGFLLSSGLRDIK